MMEMEMESSIVCAMLPGADGTTESGGLVPPSRTVPALYNFSLHTGRSRPSLTRSSLGLTVAFHPYILGLFKVPLQPREPRGFWSARSLEGNRDAERSFGFWEMKVFGG